MQDKARLCAVIVADGSKEDYGSPCCSLEE